MNTWIRSIIATPLLLLLVTLGAAPAGAVAPAVAPLPHTPPPQAPSYPDLSVTSVAPRDVQGLTPYTLIDTITNHGPVTDRNPKLWVRLGGPATIELVHSTHGKCTLASKAIVCDLGEFPVGSVATITFQVMPQQAGTIAVDSWILGYSPDADSSNDDVIAATVVSVPIADAAVSDEH
jgi:hypothetical protein